MLTRMLRLLLLDTLLLAGAFLVIEGRALLLPRTVNFPWSQFWHDASEPLSSLLTLPLFVLAVVLAGLYSRESGPAAVDKGELECLLRRKAQGRLRQRYPRPRERMARTRTVALLSEPRADTVLERLVLLKRRGVRDPRLP